MRIPLKQLLEFHVLAQGRGSAHSAWWWSVVLRESLGQWIRVPRAGVHVVLGRFPGGGKSGWLQMPGGKPGPRRAGLHGVCCLSPALGQGMSGTRKNQVWDFWFGNFLRSFQDFPSHCR